MAWEFVRAEHGRDPVDAREIAATIAKQSRPRTQMASAEKRVRNGRARWYARYRTPDG